MASASPKAARSASEKNGASPLIWPVRSLADPVHGEVHEEEVLGSLADARPRTVSERRKHTVGRHRLDDLPRDQPRDDAGGCPVGLLDAADEHFGVVTHGRNVPEASASRPEARTPENSVDPTSVRALVLAPRWPISCSRAGTAWEGAAP
jgi:hypothetical protein